MKDATRAGVALQNKKAEKLPVTEEEESKFWEVRLLGCHSAKSLLNTVYYYNGKVLIKLVNSCWCCVISI